MKFKQVLALTDFSSEAELGLHRAAMVAAFHRAALSFMVVGGEQPEGFDALARLAQRARHYARLFGIVVEPLGAVPDPLLSRSGAAGQFDLLVLPGRSALGMSTEIAADQVEQLLQRMSASALLLVKNATAGCYAQTLVAVDLKPSSRHLVEVGLDLDRNAQLILFHVLKNYQAPVAASAVEEQTPEQLLFWQDYHSARSQLKLLADACQASKGRPGISVGFGDPSGSILAAASSRRSELVVLGCELPTQSCCITVQRVTRDLSADILIVPSRHSTLRSNRSDDAAESPEPRRNRSRKRVDSPQ